MFGWLRRGAPAPSKEVTELVKQCLKLAGTEHEMKFIYAVSSGISRLNADNISTFLLKDSKLQADSLDDLDAQRSYALTADYKWGYALGFHAVFVIVRALQEGHPEDAAAIIQVFKSYKIKTDFFADA